MPDPKPLPTDAQMRRRKKVQSQFGRATSTLGLTGVGLASAGALAAHKPGLLKKIPKYSKLGDEALHAKGAKLKDAAFYTGIASGGIGGVGGFHQASIYAAEGRRRKQMQPVAKSYAGEEGHARTHQEIEEEISKDWTPVSSRYDPERQRKRRAETYPKVASGASGALAGGAVGSGVHAYFSHKGAKKYAEGLKAPMKSPVYRGMKAGVKAKGKTAAALATGSVIAGGTAAVLHRKSKSKSWEPYEKRDSTSAFGVDHSDEIEKAVLTQKARDKIKEKNFAMPGSRSYPIHDRAHARNALSRAAQSKTKGSYKAIAAKVHAKYPDLGRGGDR